MTRYYVKSAAGQPVPLSNLVTLELGTEPNALTQYNQLNSATFQAVPMPGVTTGQAIDFLEAQAKTAADRFQPRLSVRTRASMCARAAGWRLLSSLR